LKTARLLGFWDGHHLLPEGAAVVTDHFDRQALRPLLVPVGAGGSGGTFAPGDDREYAGRGTRDIAPPLPKGGKP
jgi:hypothetical protein